jgi:hypothetical protein
MKVNWVHLFDGSDFSKSLCRLVHIALDEGINLPHHHVDVDDEVVVALLPARYNNNRNNSPPQLTKITSVTLLLPFSPSAIKRPPTSVNWLRLCIARCQTRRQHPTSLSHLHTFTTSALHAFMHHVTPFPPHMPLLTKSIFFRRLNRPRLAHSGRMSSSLTCCSVGREAHVASVDDKCATPHTAARHQHAMQRTLWPLR